MTSASSTSPTTTLLAASSTSPTTTLLAASSTSSTTTLTSDSTPCQLELGLGLGLGLGIPCVITIVVVILIYTAFASPYYLGIVLGLGLGITFQVGWIIIASLISTGNKCKLELGLGLGLGSGMPDGIAYIVSVIFVFSVISIFEGIPNKVELGKGILTGLLVATVIGVIVVYLIYDKLKQEPTCIKPDDNPGTPDDKEVCVELTVTISKTNNSGSSSAVSREHVSVRMEKKGFKDDEEERPPAVHTGTQNKVEPNTIGKQTNDRKQPLPPADTGVEDTPKYRPQPRPPQNSENKDRDWRGLSANIDDTPGLANETPRPNKLPPITPKQETVQEEDALDEPRKKRNKKKKKNQMNKETPEDENGGTFQKVN